jgi:hypothetical protein
MMVIGADPGVSPEMHGSYHENSGNYYSAPGALVPGVGQDTKNSCKPAGQTSVDKDENIHHQDLLMKLQAHEHSLLHPPLVASSSYASHGLHSSAQLYSQPSLPCYGAAVQDLCVPLATHTCPGYYPSTPGPPPFFCDSTNTLFCDPFLAASTDLRDLLSPQHNAASGLSKGPDMDFVMAPNILDMESSTTVSLSEIFDFSKKSAI